MKSLALLALIAAGAWAADGQPKAPIANNPVVEIKGKITKVQVAPGQGMPFVEVQAGGRTSKVYLGSMRYLMEQNFTPKAGAEVDVRGYKTGDDVVAITVTIDGGKPLKLRDESGYPVWMGGPGRGRGGPGCCGMGPGKK